MCGLKVDMVIRGYGHIHTRENMWMKCGHVNDVQNCVKLNLGTTEGNLHWIYINVCIPLAVLQ